MAENDTTPPRPTLTLVNPDVPAVAPTRRTKSRSKSAQRARRYRAQKRARAGEQNVMPASVTPSAQAVVPGEQERPRFRGNPLNVRDLPAALAAVATDAAPSAAPVLAAVQQQGVPHEVEREARHGLVTVATLVAALALATCSAAFSISGLTSIFAGASAAVICLGVAFEIGKLSAVAWLGQRLGARALRLAITTLVAVLMVLNSLGVYGFLSRAHKAVEADLGPVRYLATLIGTADETAMRYFILVVALLLDPAAVLLLLAATHRRAVR